MTPTTNEEVTAALRELKQLGLKGTVSHKGKHLIVEWVLPSGGRRFIQTSCTPSDWRGALNVRARVRRLLKLDGIHVPVEAPKSGILEKALKLPEPVTPPETLAARVERLEKDVEGLLDLLGELQSQVKRGGEALSSAANVLLGVQAEPLEALEEEETVTSSEPWVKLLSAVKTKSRGVGVHSKLGTPRREALANGKSLKDMCLECLSFQWQHRDVILKRYPDLKYDSIGGILQYLKKDGLVENGLRGLWRKTPAARVTGIGATAVIEATSASR